MYIDKTGKRINPYSNIEVEGVTYYGNILQFPDILSTLGIHEIEEPVVPDEYDQEFWYKQEVDESPYVIYTKKSDDQIEEIKRNRLQLQIDALERNSNLSVVVVYFFLSHQLVS